MFAVFTPNTVGKPGEKGSKWMVSSSLAWELDSKVTSVAHDHANSRDTRDRILVGFQNFALSSDNVLTRKVKELPFENGNGLAYIDKECSVFQGGMTTVLVRRGGKALGKDRACKTDAGSVVPLASALGRGLVSPDMLDMQQKAMVKAENNDAAEGGFAAIVYDAMHSAVLVVRDSEGASPLYWNCTQDGRLCFSSTYEPLRFVWRAEDGHKIYKEPKAFPAGHYFAAGAGCETHFEKMSHYSGVCVEEGRPVTPEGKLWLASMPMRKYKGRPELSGEEMEPVEPDSKEAKNGKFGKHARMLASTKALKPVKSWRSLGGKQSELISLSTVGFVGKAAVHWEKSAEVAAAAE